MREEGRAECSWTCGGDHLSAGVSLAVGAGLEIEGCIIVMHHSLMDTRQKSDTPGITIRFPRGVCERVMAVAKMERRSTAAYIEHLVEQDLRRRDEQDRVVWVYVAADAPEWSGSVLRGEDETAEQHAERTEILRGLFGEPGQA